jgi:glycosyltransferase involved in cell wall biosynthesis
VHIAFVTNEYPPLPTGGIGTSVRALARALHAEGHRVSVVGWGGRHEFEDEGVHVRFVPLPSWPKLGRALLVRALRRELGRLVRTEGLDIVEAPDWCGPSAGLRLSCPVVVRCHGSATYFAHLLGERVRPSVAWPERWALRSADAVASVSRFTGDVTADLFGLRREDIRTLYNGVDVERFTPCAPGAFDPDLVLYSGTVVRKKGVLDLCRTFSQVIARRPESRLRVVGKDSPDARTGSPSTWALCLEALSPAARTRTEYLGVQPFDSVPNHLRKAAVCFMPSFAEALACAPIEAMSCGKPVVAYDIGWASEIVESGVTGYLVAPGDRDGATDVLCALLDDSSLAHRLGAAGRLRAETVFAAAVVAKTSALWYTDVLHGRR